MQQLKQKAEKIRDFFSTTKEKVSEKVSKKLYDNIPVYTKQEYFELRDQSAKQLNEVLESHIKTVIELKEQHKKEMEGYKARIAKRISDLDLS